MKHAHYLFPFAFGILFSLGLGASGMMSPQKVQGFLDLFGKWDPTLLWVLGGAVLTTVSLFPFVLKRYKPFFSAFFSLPTSTHIDTKLLLGSTLFGIGWALSGLCPGPAFANILTGNSGILLFVGTLLLSYALLEWRVKK